MANGCGEKSVPESEKSRTGIRAGRALLLDQEPQMALERTKGTGRKEQKVAVQCRRYLHDSDSSFIRIL